MPGWLCLQHQREHLFQQLSAGAAGREVREQLFDQVKGLLHDLDMGMQPISVLFPYLPTSFHQKRDSCALLPPPLFPHPGP